MIDLYTWDKQDWEDELDYEAFKIYLNNAENLNNTQMLKIYNQKFSQRPMTINQFTVLLKNNKWEERYTAWRHHVVTISTLKSETEELQALIEFQKKQKVLANTLTDIAQGLLAKATEALSQLDATNLSAANLVKFVQAAAEIAQIGLSAEASALMITDLVAILDRSNTDDKIVVKASADYVDATDLDIFRDALDDYNQLAVKNQQREADSYDEEGYL